MKKIAISSIFGLLLGVAVTYIFLTQVKEYTDETAILVKYQFLNSYTLNNGDYDAIKAQHETWISFLDTYEPKTYSTIPTEDALNIERAVAYYRLANLEKDHNNLEAYGQYLRCAVESCTAFASVDKNCTESMLETMSCIFNITGAQDCTPNNTLNQIGAESAPSG